MTATSVIYSAVIDGAARCIGSRWQVDLGIIDVTSITSITGARAISRTSVHASLLASSIVIKTIVYRRAIRKIRRGKLVFSRVVASTCGYTRSSIIANIAATAILC